MMLRALVPALVALAVAGTATAAAAEPSASELTQQITKASGNLEKVVESYNKLREEIKATRTAESAVAARLAPLQKSMSDAETKIGELAVVAYKTGELGVASALLDGGSDAFLSRLVALDRLAQDRKAEVDTFVTTRHSLTAEHARLDAARVKQEAQAKEMAARKKQIEADLDKLYEMREEAYGSATSTGSSYSGTIPSVSGKAGVAVRYAYNAIGTPYVWAAEGPNGYDCSGLTLAAWRAAGKSLPHNAAMQWDEVAHIGRGSLQPGDLVFYSGLGHVALYVGSGKVIHAPTFGESVKLASVDMMSPYGYGRVR
jgi:cell wall-associated NlpC family hydrolase